MRKLEGHTEQKLLRVYRLYNADSIDASFDTSTIRKIYTSSVLPGEMIVQGDDKILIDGDFTVNGKKVPLVRLMPDGTVDMAFINNLTLTDEVRDIELSPTGDIYVATKKAMELVRLTADGKTDAGFKLFEPFTSSNWAPCLSKLTKYN